jgi:hypothetical protein
VVAEERSGMIISHTYRYLFVEIPLTASWAIHHELVDYYGGISILHKHASFPEFERIAEAGEANYFVFATVRHPLDVVVSQYVKLRTDHREAFTSPEAIRALKVDSADIKKREFIMTEDAAFEAYFRRYHRWPFNSILQLSADRLDFVIRYENLQEDFSGVLQRLGIEQVRPVPVVNKTQGRQPDWQSYYTPEIVEQAKKSFGPFMEAWGYTFPPEWGDYTPNWRDRAVYRIFDRAQEVYWRYLRYHEGTAGKVARWMRATLTR